MSDIKIRVDADTKAVKRSVDAGIIEPLEDADKALTDLGRNRGPEQLERGMRDAQRETADFQDEIKETARTIDRVFPEAYRKLKQSSASATGDVKADLKQLGAEGRQNAAETFSSFDGSLESLVDGIQGTFGGIVSDLGPLGAIGGAVAAVGIGLAMSLWQQSQEDAQKLREEVAELASELIDAGRDGSVSMGYVADKLHEIATETEEGRDNLATWKKYADDLGLPFDKMADQLTGAVQVTREQIDALREADRQLDLADAATTNKAKAYNALITELENVRAKQEQAAAQEQAWLAAGGPEMEAKAAAISAIDAAYDEAAGAVDTYVNEETGLFDVQPYIDAMNQRAQALRDYQTSLAESGLTSEAKQFLNDQGAESAALMLQGYVSAAPEQKAELQRIWTEAGKEASGSYVNAFGQPEVKARLIVDDSALRNYQVPFKVPVPTYFQTPSNSRLLGG